MIQNFPHAELMNNEDNQFSSLFIDNRQLIAFKCKRSNLEVGIGTGLNIAYYPGDIDITAIDFSEKMLEKAER